MTVDCHLLHDRQRGRMRVFHRADHRPEIEDQLGLEFAGELLHALVFHEAADLHELDAAVARGEPTAFKQRRADTQALPPLLDAEGDLGLAPVEPQVGGTSSVGAQGFEPWTR